MAKYKVFLSHGSQDTHLVTTRVLPAIRAAGADTFLDEYRIAYGDDFRAIILRELEACNEIVVVLTATSMSRPWVCAEIGGSLVKCKFIVPMTHGVTEAAMAGAGVLSLVGTTNLLKLGARTLERFEAQLRLRVRNHARV